MPQVFKDVVLNETACGVSVQVDTISVAATSVIVSVVEVAVPHFDVYRRGDGYVSSIGILAMDEPHPRIHGVLEMNGVAIAGIQSFDVQFFDPHV
jgi:hypothetical protein